MVDLFGYDRPELGKLVKAVTQLPQYQRRELARLGRKARAAKRATIRRLAYAAAAEARQLAKQLANGEAVS